MGNCGCQNKSTNAPCGCKGTTAVAARTSCSCGGNGCSACEARAFVRPRFFAGQLLTEDDLDLLGQYVAGKNRLHNRSLWGSGVVCGLDVHCDPCGPSGTVVVEPGYAIDCCGDDIVVPCAEQVDVLALVRELQACTLGAVCADPCSSTATSVATARKGSTAPVNTYYLYVRYTENATDPVSPYATGEPCVGQACEPTRIREGHRYELRTTDDNPRFPGLYARATQCLGNVDQAAGVVGDAAVMERNSKRLAAAQASLAQTPSPVFAAADVAALQTATTNLQAALATLSQQPAGTAQPAANTQVTAAVDPTAVRAAVEATRVAGSLFARLILTPVAQRPKIDPTATQTQLASAQKLVPPAVTAANLRALETAEATTTLALTKQFGTLANPPQAPTYSDQLWALGAPLDDGLVSALVTAQTSVRAYIAANPTSKTNCQLSAQAQALQPLAAATITQALVSQLVTALDSASQVVGQLTVGCLCDAFNPPCQRCTDQAVLLAEISVQDCVVTDVCELVRRFVITWPSLRYWTAVPGFAYNIDDIGAAVQQLCCGASAGCQSTATQAQTLALSFSASPAPSVSTSNGASSSAVAQFARLLPPSSARATVPGGTAAAVDPAVAQAIQTAVSAATAAMQTELDALRTQVGQLGAKGG